MVDLDTVFRWLKYFSGSGLDTPATTLRDQIEADIQGQNFRKAHQKIEYLEACVIDLDNSVDCGDIWVEIGLAFYRMGNLRNAEAYWKKAVTDYPECHECAVARWLLGTVQWEIDTSNMHAMNNWKTAIREFRELAEQAEKDRREEDKNWYGDRIVEFEESLQEQISIKFS